MLPATGEASLGSGGEPVLVQQPAETVNSLDDVPTFEPVQGQVGDRRFEVDAAVRALAVVVGDELPQHALGMAFTADEHPVQALGPGCPHKSFGERVRPGRSNGCLDDSGADRSHHLVEGPDELGVPVTDKEADSSALVLQSGNQVPGLLGDPGPDRVSRYPGQEDHAALQVDEEQDIEAPERDRVDVEEVAGKGASGLGSQELRPRRASRPGRRA